MKYQMVSYFLSAMLRVTFLTYFYTSESESIVSSRYPVGDLYVMCEVL